MKLANKKVMSKEEMKDWMGKNNPSLVVMAGAGDIDAQVKEVKELLQHK